ncbi:MAG: hypothetical protein ACFFDP_10865 [Promethearchaeota archaeon]
MLLSILIAFAMGLVYWQNPSKTIKRLSCVLAILVSLGLSFASVFVVLSSSHVVPNVTFTAYVPLSFPISVFRHTDSLNNVFSQTVGFLWPYGFPILFSGYKPTDFFNITFFNVVDFLVVGIINLVSTILSLKFFYKWVVHHLPRIILTDHIADEPIVGEGGYQPPIAASNLLIRKTKRTKRVRVLLVSTGLILLLIGTLFTITPLRAPNSSIEKEFNYTPATSNSNSVIFPFNFAYAVHVTVSFDNYSLSDDRRVWLKYDSGLRTPFFGFGSGGGLARWENVTSIEFKFGMENSTLFFIDSMTDEIIRPFLALLFIHTLSVDVYYSGTRFASCNVSIVIFQNLLFVPGLILLSLAAIPFWILIGMVWIQYRKERTKLSKKPDDIPD